MNHVSLLFDRGMTFAKLVQPSVLSRLGRWLGVTNRGICLTLKSLVSGNIISKLGYVDGGCCVSDYKSVFDVAKCI